MDREILIQDDILLFIHYKKKMPFLSRRDFTIIINDREFRDVPFKHGTCINTTLQKGEFIKDVLVCTGSLKIKGYCFPIRECVEELHLKVDEKGEMTLNDQPSALIASENCLLM
ncbi:Hypothetical protein BRZCDTV_495 [Brazilian cedratvirus IHUMI]|uniref:Uncharacterized protein n=1 Tax=Brazilian cedratvirus IHUMI TaxID=2126980 RepID=A0A2R8FFD7_9VIRU|nr:Hypothetical protein BRZCDTV_495 [Brazilian cedratvirus IHUMI]